MFPKGYVEFDGFSHAVLFDSPPTFLYIPIIMNNNYIKIITENLNSFYSNLPEDIEISIPAKRNGDGFEFNAFGGICRVQPKSIFIDGQRQDEAVGILLSLYALHANAEPCHLEPFKAFKEFPDSMPYIGAFTTHTEKILLPHVTKIKAALKTIMDRFEGEPSPPTMSGDLSFVIYPLPKIALCYIFYDADEDFPPSATCLFSNNALRFMPIAALADVGEYTSKAIIDAL